LKVVRERGQNKGKEEEEELEDGVVVGCTTFVEEGTKITSGKVFQSVPTGW
jgi:hypothetical protein